MTKRTGEKYLLQKNWVVDSFSPYQYSGVRGMVFLRCHCCIEYITPVTTREYKDNLNFGYILTDRIKVIFILKTGKCSYSLSMSFLAILSLKT